MSRDVSALKRVKIIKSVVCPRTGIVPLPERLERVTDAAFDSASCNITMDMPNMTEDEKIAFNKILDALRTAYRGVMV